MTKEEKAIRKLTRLRDYYDQLDLDQDREDDEDPTNERDILDALKMAIKALEKEPCEDAISRGDVKYAIKPYIQEIITESGVDKNEHTNRTVRAILNTIETMPSVQSRSSWIPIDKQKPEEYQLIWFTDDYGNVDMGKVIYGYTRLEGVVNGRRFDRNEIVAWIPINKPEPYKVESEK